MILLDNHCAGIRPQAGTFRPYGSEAGVDGFQSGNGCPVHHPGRCQDAGKYALDTIHPFGLRHLWDAARSPVDCRIPERVWHISVQILGLRTGARDAPCANRDTGEKLENFPNVF